MFIALRPGDQKDQKENKINYGPDDQSRQCF